MILITTKRVRSVISDAHTETEAAAILRQHKIHYTFSTNGGVFHILIPTRSGSIRVIRTASRSAPLIVSQAPPAPFRSPAKTFYGLMPITPLNNRR